MIRDSGTVLEWTCQTWTSMDEMEVFQQATDASRTKRRRASGVHPRRLWGTDRAGCEFPEKERRGKFLYRWKSPVIPFSRLSLLNPNVLSSSWIWPLQLLRLLAGSASDTEEGLICLSCKSLVIEYTTYCRLAPWRGREDKVPVRYLRV